MDNFYKIASALEANDSHIESLINKEKKKPEEISDYLRNLNNFLYSYFLIKYEKNLIKVYTDNNQKILEKSDINLFYDICASYKDAKFEKLKHNDNDIIDECIKLINENFNKKLNLEKLAKDIHVSKNYLCCLFKQKTGFTPCYYLNILRVNHAKELIKKDKTFDYISYDCGFCSHSHFSTTFKKITGQSPSAYKNSLYVNKKSRDKK